MLAADTAPGRTASAWDAFYAGWVEPTLRFGTPALIVFVLLLVAVRALSKAVVGAAEAGVGGAWRAGYATALLALALVAVDAAVTLPLAFQHTPHRTVQTMLWITVGLIGVCGALAVGLFAERVQTRDIAVYGTALLAVVAVVGLAVAFPDKWHAPIAVIVWAAILAALGVVVAARERGLELGLRIEGHDKDGKDDAGLGEYLRVRLHSLGTAPPRGVQLSQQTDVSTLPDTALTLLPEGTLAKAAALAVQLFQRATPWRAIVTEQADGALSIVLLRNGRIAEAIVIRRGLLELDDDDAADPSNVVLRTAAAAFLLLQLAERHETLRIGLAGATDWRSVALQLIAANRALPLPRRVELLTRATVFDPHNLAARAAYEYAAHQTRHDDLHAYAGRLETLAAELGQRRDARPLELRMLFNIVTVRLNAALDIGPGNAADDLKAAAATAKTLCARLATTRAEDRGGKLTRLVDEITSGAWALYEAIRVLQPKSLEPWPFAVTEPLTMLSFYQRACLRMLQDAPAAAMQDLLIATQDPRFRREARTDRSFDGLQSSAEFKALVGDPAPATFLALEQLEPHAPALRRLGHGSANAIAALKATALARELDVPAAEAGALIELAALHEWLRAQGEDAAATTFLLARADVLDRAALRIRLAQANEFAQELLRAAAPYAVVAPTYAKLIGWRAGLT